MQVTVQGLNGEFATSTMTLGKVTSVPSIASYQTSHPNEAGGLSGTVPMNAPLFTFLDNAQPAGVLGFPSTFVPNNFANRNGRSNFIAVWQEVAMGDERERRVVQHERWVPAVARISVHLRL